MKQCKTKYNISIHHETIYRYIYKTNSKLNLYKYLLRRKAGRKQSKKAQAIYKRGQWLRFFFTKNGLGGIARKTYLKITSGKVVTNLWLHDDAGHTDEAKKEVKLFNMETVFATPKQERLIQRIIHVATNQGGLVLDSFLGSYNVCRRPIEHIYSMGIKCNFLILMKVESPHMKK